MSIGKDGHVYRDKPIPEPPQEFLDALDNYYQQEEEDLKAAGMELMDRWNRGRVPAAEMAGMGHLDGDSYQFLLQRDGSTYQVTVKKE